MSTIGMPLPTQAGMIGSTPSKSAFTQIQGDQQSLLLLKKVGGKGKRGGATVAVPILDVPILAAPYQSANGPGQDTTAQQVAMAKLSLQSGANSEFDKFAVKNGGSRSRKSRSRKSRSGKSRSGKSRSRKSRSRKSRSGKYVKRRYRR